MKNKTFIFCFLFVAPFACSMRADNMIRYVSLAGSSTSPYTNWAMAATNFADGVDATPNNGTLYVAPGVYYATRSISVGGNRTITINTTDGAETTFYNGGRQSFFGIQVAGGATVYLTGLTFNDFFNDGENHNYPLEVSGNAILDSCVFMGNTNWAAGAARVTVGGRLHATKCVFLNNTGLRTGMGGGAIESIYAEEAIFDACTFIGNTATSQGGAINGRGIIRNSFLTGNHGTTAVLHFRAGDDNMIENSIIVSNTSGAIGVVAIERGANLHIRNSLIKDNQTMGRGGGITLDSNGGTYFILENSTVVGNAAGDGTLAWNQGGGIYFREEDMDITIVNSIIYNNIHNATSNYYFNAQPDVVWLHNCTAPEPSGAEETITANPMLDENARLTPGSPCINAALYDSWMDNARDLDGLHRIDRVWGKPDIGAYEYLPAGMLFKGM